MKVNSSLVSLHRVSLLAIVAIAFGLAAPRVALGCSHPPPDPPDVVIISETETSAEICILGYTTFGASANHWCACALNKVGPIESVDSVTFTETGTGNPIFDIEFVEDGDVENGFNNVQAADWTGFLGGTGSLEIYAGVPIDIKFQLTLSQQRGSMTLEEALAAAPVLIATDEADSTGNPLATHQSLLPAGDVSIATFPPVPGLTLIGMIALIVLVGAGAAWKLLRR